MSLKQESRAQLEFSWVKIRVSWVSWEANINYRIEYKQNFRYQTKVEDDDDDDDKKEEEEEAEKSSFSC